MVLSLSQLLTKATFLTSLLLLPSLTSAHTKHDESLTVPHLSLPDLSKLDYVDSLGITDWDILGDGIFLDGRIILTPEQNTKSSLVNKNLFENLDKWTFEIIFRSLNQVGRTGSGLSLQLFNSEYKLDKDGDFIYGGLYDGLNVVVDAESSKANAIHAYLNDGTKNIKTSDKVTNDAFGSCLIHYQDSQVPNTMRISYSKGEYLLVQIDNRICFKTAKVDLSDIKSFKISAKASTGSAHEQFEILKLKVYKGIISEVEENMDKFANQPIIVKKVVDTSSGKPPVTTSNEQELSSQDSNAFLAHIKDLTQANLELQHKLQSLDSKISSYQAQLRSTIDTQFEALKNEKIMSPSTGESSDDLTKQLNALVAQFSNKLDALKTQTEAAANSNGSGLDLSHVQNVKWWLMVLLFFVVVLCFVLGYSLVYLRNELKRKIL